MSLPIDLQSAHADVLALRNRVDALLDELTEMKSRADDAEAENVRLRAGEADAPGDRWTTPTPAEWIRRWNDATPQQRLDRTVRIIEEARMASRCILQNHQAYVEHERSGKPGGISPLNDSDRLALKVVQDLPCTTPGCPCAAWKRDVADNLRLTCPTVDDATLAHVTLQVSANITRYAVERHISALGAGGLLGTVALELAAAELDNPAG